MFTRLIESRRRRQRSAGATLVSVLAHATVLGFVVHATLRANTPAPPDRPPESIIWVPSPPPAGHPAPPAPPAPPVATRCADCLVAPPLHPVIDLAIPPAAIPSGPPIVQPDFPMGSGSSASPSGTPGGDPGGGGGDGFTETPDDPARALAGNPRPEYPALLRNLRVEAVVHARYVVDTTGRVEPSSIAFDGGEELFQLSVRRALLACRFTPARTRGRAVRMLVRQDFAFRLTR